MTNDQKQPALETRGLFFRYSSDVPPPDEAGADQSPFVLSGIDLSITAGEHVAIIGANGSGKTTLLKHFNALLLPTQGEVMVGGLSTTQGNNLPAIRRCCGMILQNPDNQIVATTVEEDIAFGLENYAVEPGEMRCRVDAVMHRLGLTGLAHRPPHYLSGGQKQRVAIAGVLALQPSCLLMDEPTAMLDREGRREVLEVVGQLNREMGITVIHVTHFPEEAALAGRVLVLHRGSVVVDGPPAEVFSNLPHLHSFGLEGTPAAEAAAILRQRGLDLPLSLYRLDDLMCWLSHAWGGSCDEKP